MKKGLVFAVGALLVTVFALPTFAAGGKQAAPAPANSAVCLTQDVTPIVIEGTIKADSTGNWATMVDAQGKEYDLRFGPTWYKAVQLKEGQKVKAEGIISPRFEGSDPARFSVFNYSVDGGEKVVLRGEAGRPAWTGQGKGRGNGQGFGQGRGCQGQCPMVNNQ